MEFIYKVSGTVLVTNKWQFILITETMEMETKQLEANQKTLPQILLPKLNWRDWFDLTFYYKHFSNSK